MFSFLTESGKGAAVVTPFARTVHNYAPVHVHEDSKVIRGAKLAVFDVLIFLSSIHFDHSWV